MATPLSATHRMTIAYQVKSRTHKLRMYVKLGAPIAGVQQFIQRDGVTLTPFPTAAQEVWDIIRSLLEAATPAASALLEVASGPLPIWLPVDTATLTGVGTHSGAANIASQATWVVRDSAFNKVKVLVMEHCEGYLGHSNTGLGVSTPLDSVTTNLFTSGAPADSSYFWQVGRSNLYLLTTGTVAGLTLDLNDKLKRDRGEA